MIEDLLRATTLFDIVVVLVVLGLFVAGWLQGAIRQLLGIATLLVAFVLAGGLRDPLGDFLARNWTYYDRAFNLMIAWLGQWVALSVTFQIALQAFYRRVLIHHRLVIVDEIVGGALGAFQVVLVVTLLTIVINSYYVTITPPVEARDIRWVGDLWTLLEDSAIVGALQDGFIPGIEALLRPLLPADVGATPA